MTQWSSTAGSKQQVGTLTWNANGTLQSLQINDTANPTNTQTCTNLYDDLGRLSSNSCAGGWGQSFSYDQFGNITKTLISGHSGLSFQPTYVVPTNNRIASVPGALIHYDGMGNMTQDNLVNNYTYDAEGRPITAATVQTTFDPFGRATEQNRNSVYTQIVYSPGGTKFAFMNGTTLIKYMAPMAAGMAAVHTGPNGNPPNSGYFQHADWLGSSRLANDGGGNATYDRSYAPFGEPYDETATTNRDFTGQNQDTVSGLYDFLFREQSPVQGRWLVPDPAGLAAVDITNPQTWNRYAYVGNQPLTNVDPLGLQDDGGVVIELPPNVDQPLFFFDPTALEFVCRNGEVTIDGVDGSAWVCGFRGHGFALGGGGSGGGRKKPAANNCVPGTKGCFNVPQLCANVPKSPPGASATFNANLVSQETQGMWPATKLDFFYQVFKTGGAFDYKTPNDPQYVDYGNWNFGYVCGANYPALFCQSAAGGNRMWRAAMQGTNPFGSGFPFLKSPYGDQAVDNHQIQNGIQAGASGCVQ